MKKGDRVQAHPATDAFMQGDRYGDVVLVNAQNVYVQMDRSGKVRKFRREDVEPAD